MGATFFLTVTVFQKNNFPTGVSIIKGKGKIYEFMYVKFIRVALLSQSPSHILCNIIYMFVKEASGPGIQ